MDVKSLATMSMISLFAIAAILALIAGPSIYFTVIGAQEVAKNHGSRKKTVCEEESNPIGIGNWLLVDGALSLAQIVVGFLTLAFVALCAMKPGVASCGTAGLSTMVLMFLLIVGGLFQIAWLGVGGAVLWSSKDKCRKHEPMLWYSGMACFLIGVISIVMGGFSGSKLPMV